MKNDWVVAARILHVVAIVVWIGGIGAVTTVMFPTMRRLESNEQKVWMFRQIENRFRPQARIAWLIVGLSGVFMLFALNAWVRFAEPRYWWMQAMVALWVLFGLMLFIIEPLVVGPRMEQMLTRDPARALIRMERMHWVLLILSLLVIAAVVGGVYGWL
ncbi:MAG: hypothetical protein ACREQR_16455 [Candidatus Binataceae bacterium]